LLTDFTLNPSEQTAIDPALVAAHLARRLSGAACPGEVEAMEAFDRAEAPVSADE
jgi:hypothetical protein